MKIIRQEVIRRLHYGGATIDVFPSGLCWASIDGTATPLPFPSLEEAEEWVRQILKNSDR